MSTRPLDVGGTILAALFILLGAWVLHQAEAMSRLGSIFPRTIAIAMMVAAAGSILMSLLRPSEPVRREPASWPRRIGFVAAMAAWVVLIPVLGFYTTSLIAFLALMVVANHDPWTPLRAIALTIAAIAMVTGFQALFRTLLNVPLPTGLLY